MKKIFLLLTLVSVAFGQIGIPGVVHKLTVTEYIVALQGYTMAETTTPSALAGHGKIYVKDNKLCFLDSTGVEHTVHLDLPEKAGTFAYLSATDTTTVTTGGTYYAIEGAFTNSPATSFTAVAGPPVGLRYDGTETRYFEIDWHTALKGNSNGMTVHCGIAIDGTTPTPCSIMGTFLKTAAEEQALSGTCVVQLAQNEIVTLVLTADDNGDLVTVDHFTTSIRPFFASE